jgi:hypothetical protein
VTSAQLSLVTVTTVGPIVVVVASVGLVMDRFELWEVVTVGTLVVASVGLVTDKFELWEVVTAGTDVVLVGVTVTVSMVVRYTGIVGVVVEPSGLITGTPTLMITEGVNESQVGTVKIDKFEIVVNGASEVSVVPRGTVVIATPRLFAMTTTGVVVVHPGIVVSDLTEVNATGTTGANVVQVGVTSVTPIPSGTAGLEVVPSGDDTAKSELCAIVTVGTVVVASGTIASVHPSAVESVTRFVVARHVGVTRAKFELCAVVTTGVVVSLCGTTVCGHESFVCVTIATGGVVVPQFGTTVNVLVETNDTGTVRVSVWPVGVISASSTPGITVELDAVMSGLEIARLDTVVRGTAVMLVSELGLEMDKLEITVRVIVRVVVVASVGEVTDRLELWATVTAGTVVVASVGVVVSDQTSLVPVTTAGAVVVVVHDGVTV